MRNIMSVIFVLAATAVFAQTAVETQPLKPAPSITIIEEARTLGTSPNDLDVDEVTLVAAPALSMRVRGGTRRIGMLITDSLRVMARKLEEARLTPAAPAMAIFDQLGDADFSAELMIPLAEKPAAAPSGLRLVTTPKGGAVRIVHRGAYEDIDATYEELSTFVEDRDIPVEDVVIERYLGELVAGSGAPAIEIIALKR